MQYKLDIIPCLSVIYGISELLVRRLLYYIIPSFTINQLKRHAIYKVDIYCQARYELLKYF